MVKVLQMKKLQYFCVLVSRMVYLTVRPPVFNSRVGNYWIIDATGVHKVVAIAKLSSFYYKLRHGSHLKDSSYNEQPNLLSNGPLLAEQ